MCSFFEIKEHWESKEGISFSWQGHRPLHRFSAFCRTSPVSEHSKLGDTCRCITHGNVPNLWHHDSFLHILLSRTMCKITTVSPSVLIRHSHTSSFRVNHSVFWFSEAFLSRSLVAQEENNRHQCQSDWPTDERRAPKTISVSLSHVHTSKVRRTILPFVATKLPKGGKASFRHSELYTKTRRHTNEQREHPHSEEGTPCSNCNKNRRIRLPTHSTISLTPFLPTHPSPQKSQPVHVERKASRARLSTLCSWSSKEDVPSLPVQSPPPLLQTGLFGQPYFRISLSSGEESPSEGHSPQPPCGDRSRHVLSLFRLGCRARVQPPSHGSK